MVRGTKGKHRSALLAAALSKALDIPCWLPTFSGTRTWIECKRHWFIPLFTDELWQEVGLSDLVSTAERLMKGPLPPSYPPAKQEADKKGDEEVEMVKASEEEPDEVKEEEAAEVPEAKDGPSPAPSPADMPEAAEGSDKKEEGTPTEPPPPVAPAPDQDQEEDGPWIEIARPTRPARPKPQPTARSPDSPPSEFIQRSSDQET